MLKAYFASPFFNPEQVEREEALKKILRDKGIQVFSPKEEFHLAPDATKEEQEKTFKGNLKGMYDADFVFAITDGKDMGTIWEAGFAYGLDIPVYYFAETLGNGQFNLMLARSGKGVFTNRQSVIDFDFETLIDINMEWEGEIE